ncbi:MAG: protein arginine kinase [Phycisphaerales bacterium]|jgi:protein arginine kinase
MVEGGTNGGSMPTFGSGTEWLRGAGAACDVVMSSRVRLARNLSGYPFQTTADEGQQAQVLELARARLMSVPLAESVMWIDLREISATERELLVERQLISRQHAKGKISGLPASADRPRAVAVGLPDERLSVMVNEEDHLRLQSIRSGLALTSAYEELDATDDDLEAGLDLAFHPRFGYLTCCPTNVGTGIRLSVMLHLAGLKLTGEIEKVKHAAMDMSLAVRGFHGEGSDAAGDLYQLSNQTTLGKSERVLLQEMERDIVPRVIDYERHARKVLMETRRVWLEDRVHRAMATLLGARLMATNESLELLGVARLGAVLGLLPRVDQITLNSLMLEVQPAHLQRSAGASLDQQERRIERARLIRARLTGPIGPNGGSGGAGGTGNAGPVAG